MRTGRRSRQAPQGERMIEVKVRFWTNNIVKGKGRVVPGEAWSNGVVRMERNTVHEIEPRPPRPFQSLMDLPSVLEKVLIEHGIVLHPSRRARKHLGVLPGARRR